MNDFPRFMKNPQNSVAPGSQSRGVEGYVYDGADGSQMAHWKCCNDGASEEHTHEFDEYFIVIQGEYTLVFGEKKVPVRAGEEYYIPRGTPHAGEFKAGTRTIHAFGGKRAVRNI